MHATQIITNVSSRKKWASLLSLAHLLRNGFTMREPFRMA